MCEPCSTCEGRATVKTAETVCFEVFRAILDDSHKRRENDTGRGDYVVHAAQNVVDRLLDEEAHNVRCLSEQVKREIRVQVEPSYGPEQFDVVLAQDLSR
jgi:ribonuclease G